MMRTLIEGGPVNSRCQTAAEILVYLLIGLILAVVMLAPGCKEEPSDSGVTTEPHEVTPEADQSNVNPDDTDTRDAGRISTGIILQLTRIADCKHVGARREAVFEWADDTLRDQFDNSVAVSRAEYEDLVSHINGVVTKNGSLEIRSAPDAYYSDDCVPADKYY